jgi:hypothetical protein
MVGEVTLVDTVITTSGMAMAITDTAITTMVTTVTIGMEVVIQLGITHHIEVTQVEVDIITLVAQHVQPTLQNVFISLAKE